MDWMQLYAKELIAKNQKLTLGEVEPIVNQVIDELNKVLKENRLDESFDVRYGLDDKITVSLKNELTIEIAESDGYSKFMIFSKYLIGKERIPNDCIQLCKNGRRFVVGNNRHIILEEAVEECLASLLLNKKNN